MQRIAFILLPGITNIPLWVKPETTIRDLFLRAAELQDVTRRGPNLNAVLGDLDYQPLLDQGVFQSELLEGKVLNLFNPTRLLLVIISFAGHVYRFQLPAAATVRDVKQHFKKQLPSESRQDNACELLITGSGERPEGSTSLMTLARLPHQNVCFDLIPQEAAQVRTPLLCSVNERLFRKHLQQHPFQAGVDQGLWRLVRIHWPRATFAISTSARTLTEYFVRFRLDDYPAKSPGVELWDEQQQFPVVADRWPDWFNYFVEESYPNLVTIDPARYSTALLELSVSIAARKKHLCSESWNLAGDITQCLTPMLHHLLSQTSQRKTADVNRRRVRQLVPQQQSA